MSEIIAPVWAWIFFMIEGLVVARLGWLETVDDEDSPGGIWTPSFAGFEVLCRDIRYHWGFFFYFLAPIAVGGIVWLFGAPMGVAE